MPLKVLLVDDHKIMLEGLNSLINTQADMTVIGSASNGSEAVRLTEKLSPDIVIMDITMPGLNGISATEKITSGSGNTKVIVLSIHNDKLYVMKAFKAGAKGYLLKKSTFDELICAINTVNNDSVYISAGISDIIIDNFVQSLTKKKSVLSPILTARETEVLGMIAEGKSTKQIASFLYVSMKTVESHRKKIMDKLQIYSIAELTKYAIREGLTSVEF
jgi:DNA-binding NarL/FixJ family response regulator